MASFESAPLVADAVSRAETASAHFVPAAAYSARSCSARGLK
jgi:hypothetical protein